VIFVSESHIDLVTLSLLFCSTGR